MKDNRQFTITENRKDAVVITTGMTMSQMLKRIKDLPTGEQWVIEVRTPENDPMQFGP